ncbi:hypothetical protein [Microlunatus soli]|uniref:VIT family protein n=1 Tax=Microlunatus soli TaxID=630515 RepID=A0A1H1PUB4_9ACTN|nr:hypothetical protein [Microlunatus soli]SDS14716.1 hypothetical protein SAMN04489812_1024 [Microlunatus soli]
MSRRRRRAWAEGLSPDQLTEVVKERLYATITGLAILLAIRGHGEIHEPLSVLGTLVIGVLAITLAGFVADVVSHLSVHRTFPDRHELGHLVLIGRHAIGVVVVPAVLLLISTAGGMRPEAAVTASVWTLVITLIVVGYLAVRRAQVIWWQKLVAVAMLGGLGVLVVFLQVLAHG